MEFIKKIYQDYLSQGESFYDEAELMSKILENECTFKSSLKKNELFLFEKLQSQKLELRELESLHLIEFVIKNAEKYIKKQSL